MQKALTIQRPSEDDCFAGGAVTDAEITDIPLSPVSKGGRPLYNLRFADNIAQLGGSEVLQQLTFVLCILQFIS